MKTYQYRIKDSTHKHWLCRKASIVNYIWNQVQETKLNFFKCFNDWLSEYDCNKILKYPKIINSTTVQCVHSVYYDKCFQSKRSKLRWRTSKKSLGWIPFNKLCVSFNTEKGIATYMKRKFKVWYSQELKGKILSGSFNQDAKGNWFINIVTDYKDIRSHATEERIGIDLGCKTQITCSDGVIYERPNITKRYEEKLAKAQRAHKKKQVTKIHTKIRNIRKDWTHKVTTNICNTYGFVAVGNIGSKGLARTHMAKSIYDLAAGMIKTMLLYKAIRHGMVAKIISEMFSTVTCSVCHQKTGPSGLSDLGVRVWSCPCCGTRHNRDVNAAINILNSVTDV